MRALLFAALLAAGCLSEPTGLDQSWPPPGVAAAAIAAGDLDGDGIDELVVVDVGAEPGVFLLGGATDLAPSPGAVARYTARIALPLAAPAKALIFADRIVVLDHTATGARVHVLDEALALQWTATVTTPAEGVDALSVHPSTFGVQGSVIFTAGAVVRFFERIAITATTTPAQPTREILAPGGFMQPIAADVGVDGATTVALVSEPMRTRRGTSTAMPPVFTWTDVRTGSLWPFQIAAPINADAVPDVIALSDTRAVCVIDGSITAAQPACLSQPLPQGPPPIALLFEELGGPPGRDLVVVRDAGLLVLPGLRVTGAAPGMVTADPLAMLALPTVPAAATTWGTTATPPRAIVLIAASGAIECLLLAGTTLTPCTR